MLAGEQTYNEIQELSHARRAMMGGGQHADVIAVIAIVVAWIAMIAIINPVGDFPLNDDWIYGGSAELLARTGEFRIPGYPIANVLSQAAWGAGFCLLFGTSYTVLRFSTLILGLVGLLALYALIRNIGGDRRTALLGSATLAVNPLYVQLAHSYMTDVPFASLSIVAIALFARGFWLQSRLSLLAGVIVSLTVLLDRQFAIVLLLGLAVAYPFRFGRNAGSVIRGVIPLGLGLALHYAYQRWLIDTGRGPGVVHLGITDVAPRSVPMFLLRFMSLSANAAPYFGLFALPWMIDLSARSTRARGARWETAVRVACALLAFGLCYNLWRSGAVPALENVLMPWGLGPLTLRDTYILHQHLPPTTTVVVAIWIILSALGAFGDYLLLCTVIFALADWWKGRQDWEPGRRALAVYMAVVMAAYWTIICLIADVTGFFDRYLLFMLPMILIFVTVLARPQGGDAIAVRGSPGAIWAVPIVALGIFAAFSAAETHDYLAWNRTRWTAINDLIHVANVAPEKIDGGYEYNGRYFYDPSYLEKPGTSWWWIVDDEYAVAFGDLENYRRIREYPIKRWLPLSEPAIVVSRRLTPGGG